MRFSAIFFLTLLICITISKQAFAGSSPDALGHEFGIICTNCNNAQQANVEARTKEPALKCASPNPEIPVDVDNALCTSNPRLVVVINPITRQTFGFQLSHQQTSPWALTTVPVLLTEDQKTGYLQTADFARDFLQAVSRANQGVQQLTTPISQTVTTVDTATTASCPNNTALSILVDANKMLEFKNLATWNLSVNLGGNVQSYFNQSAKIDSVGFHATYKGQGFNIGWSREAMQPVYIKTFSQSERVTSFADVLVFDMELKGFNNNHMPIIDFKLNDASRVGGYPVSSLRGIDGPIKITDPCVLEKLKLLKQQGEFQNPQGGASPFGSGLPPSPPSSGVDTCTVLFFQWSSIDSSRKLVYLFRVPIGQCS